MTAPTAPDRRAELARRAEVCRERLGAALQRPPPAPGWVAVEVWAVEAAIDLLAKMEQRSWLP